MKLEVISCPVFKEKVEKMYCRVSPSLYQNPIATERWVLYHAVLLHVTAPKVTYVHVYVQRGHLRDSMARDH